MLAINTLKIMAWLIWLHPLASAIRRFVHKSYKSDVATEIFGDCFETWVANPAYSLIKQLKGKAMRLRLIRMMDDETETDLTKFK